LKEKNTVLFIIIGSVITIILYSAIDLGYYRNTVAFKPGENLSTTLNQSGNNNESSINATQAVDTNESSVLKVIMLVNNPAGSGVQPSDFYITIYSSGGIFEARDQAHPSSFAGSAKGTISIILPGNYILGLNDVINGVPYSLKFSGNCVAKNLNSAEIVIRPGDKVACTVTATNVNF
jgi:hypothetical protein